MKPSAIKPLNPMANGYKSLLDLLSAFSVLILSIVCVSISVFSINFYFTLLLFAFLCCLMIGRRV